MRGHLLHERRHHRGGGDDGVRLGRGWPRADRVGGTDREGVAGAIGQAGDGGRRGGRAARHDDGRLRDPRRVRGDGVGGNR